MVDETSGAGSPPDQEPPEMPGDGIPEDGVPPDLPVMTSGMNAPTIFADGCVFAAVTDGVVRLQFVESIFDPMNIPQPGHKIRHVATVVLPKEGFAATLAYLNARAEESDIEIPDVPPVK